MNIKELLSLPKEQQQVIINDAVEKTLLLHDVCDNYSLPEVKTLVGPYLKEFRTKHIVQNLIPSPFSHSGQFGQNVDSVPQMSFNHKSTNDFCETVNDFGGKHDATLQERKVMYQYILDNLCLKCKGKSCNACVCILFVAKTCNFVKDRDVILREFPFLFSILNECLKVLEPEQQNVMTCDLWKMVGWCLLENKVADLCWIPT